MAQGAARMEANPLMGQYGERIERINAALDAEIQSYSGSEFAAPLRYAIRDGKRIRPLMLVLAAECVGHAGEVAYTAACALEFLHTQSVIHDDIIDNESQRRSLDPFHIRYGYNTAILTGDFVLGMILNMSSRIGSARVTRDLATTAMLMSEGEVLEGKLASVPGITFGDYAKVIRYKTAVAFEAAARMGGTVAGADDAQVAALTEYGRNVGVAYQIRDDLADWNNEEKLFNTLIRKEPDPRGAFDRMEAMLASHAGEARSALDGLPCGAARDGLLGLAEFASIKE
ncbi:MAG: polyprenyl synthetase family protein [Thaumarchaeota archaeon]|nr:polyprenyl synthetase family protein [Nitrososphaerota archaeon]MDD9809891.1 polyprenyl synthetase family protein [Nitrososphaerota archaeon]MDD9813960.1 polyprenyl synthetase family protein [Nitrososphaerota archaeon]MDD9842692.1 polyprenyl synthetase family protein [Nitrososphaerota archaeon]